jgi:site-specific recombinase XerD
VSIRIYKRKHKNTTTWTASVTVHGVTLPRKPHTRGGFSTREQAEQYAKAKEQELLSRLEGIPELRKAGFNEFAARYLEYCQKNNTPGHYASKKSVINRSIMPFFGNRKLISLRPHGIEAYISKRREDGASQKTILNEYTILKHMLNQAVKWDYLRANPCIKVNRPKVVQPLPEVLSESQIRHVLQFTTEHEEFHHCFFLVKVLFYTGCRRGEISNLRWCDVDLEQNIITIQAHDQWHPKDYEARTIGISSALHKTLVEFRKWQVALNVYGKYLLPRQIYGREDYLTETMRRLMKAAGVKVKQPMHIWRHSFAYHMIRGGVKPAYLQQLMGHQDIRTTMSYLRLTQTDVSQQTECLPEF